MADRERAEPLRIHLAQTAWLEPRRHQCEIRAGEDAPRIAVIEADIDGNRAGAAALRLHQRNLETGFTAAGHDDLSACGNDGVGGGEHEIDALLMDQTCNDAEQWPTRHRQPETLTNVIGIGAARFPFTGSEGAGQIGTDARIPGLIDAIEDAGQFARVGALAQQPFETAAEFRRRDLAGIGFADGCQMRRIDDAAFEKRQLVVKFETFDVEGFHRRADAAQRLFRKQALIGEVVDRQDGRQPDLVPGKIGRHQRRRPVIGVNEISGPVLVECAGGQSRCRRRKAPEANVIVRPVAAIGVAVRIAGTLVKLRTKQDVNRQTVFCRSQPERAGRHLSQRRTFADDLDAVELSDDVPITGQHHPNVTPKPQRPWQRR